MKKEMLLQRIVDLRGETMKLSKQQLEVSHRLVQLQQDLQNLELQLIREDYE
jgi:hypothetical protein